MKIFSALSGGLDSTVLLYHLIEEGHAVRPIWFHYGQRHQKETNFALHTATRLSSSGRIPGFDAIDLENVFERFVMASNLEQNQNAGALLMASTAVPDGHYTDDVMKATIVPSRNLIFAAVMGGITAARGYEAIALAVHAGDHAIYPDCRPDFWVAVESALALGVDVQTQTPFLNMNKAQIVKLGADLGVPFEDTWSCYKGEEIHCGTCGTCCERQEAFKLAGIADPTRYVTTASELYM